MLAADQLATIAARNRFSSVHHLSYRYREALSSLIGFAQLIVSQVATDHPAIALSAAITKDALAMADQVDAVAAAHMA